MNIYLMRHGQTDWNAIDNKIHQTHSDGIFNRLTKKGYEQAYKIGDFLEGIDFDVAYHSPLNRTKQTLDGVLYDNNTEIVEEPAITEMSLGFLDGKTRQYWEEKFPETKRFYEARDVDKYNPSFVIDDYTKVITQAQENARQNLDEKEIPAIESYKDVVARTKGFMEDVIHSDAKNVLIVGHQGINRALLGHLLVDTEYLSQTEDIVNLRTPNACVFKYDTDTKELYHNCGDGWNKGLIKEE